MSQNHFAALFLFSFLTVGHVHSSVADSHLNIERACTAKNDYLKSAKQSATSVEQMINSVVSEKHDVILIGVEHGNFEAEFYPSLARMIKNKSPNVDCFFMEDSIGEADTEIIHQFNQNVPGAEEKLKLNWAYDLFSSLKKQGLKIYYVDYPGKDTMPLETEEDSLKWLNARDSYMAEYITQLKKSGQCKAAIYPVGASHMVEAKNRHELKSQLKEKGLKTSELLLLIAGRNSANLQANSGYSLINPGLMWVNGTVSSLASATDKIMCKENLSIPQKPFAFFNKPTNVPVAYLARDNTFLGTFGEFQGTIVYSCQTANCQKENEILEKSLRDKNVELY